LIEINNRDIRSVPQFIGNGYCCEVCERCVAGCPGLAITLVDYRNNPDNPLVSIPFEFTKDIIRTRERITVLDTTGNPLGDFEVMHVHAIPSSDRTLIVQVQVPKEIATKVAGVKIQEDPLTLPMDEYVEHVADDVIVCRCERVTAGEIRALIRQGYRDMNELKIVTRAGMGACGSKTCNTLIFRLFREEGIPAKDIVDTSKRPVFVEVPLSIFAGMDPKKVNQRD
jgi:bacterioferritin-associated ferredoxin